MSNTNWSFDSSGIAPTVGGITLWQAGWTPVVIIDSDLKRSRNNDQNGYAELKIEAIDGPNKGKIHFINVNLWNTNADAQRIAQQEMSAICHVTGVMAFQNDASILFNRPFLINAAVNPATPATKDQRAQPERNDWIGYKTIDGREPAQVQGQFMPSFNPGGAPQQQVQQNNQQGGQWGNGQQQNTGSGGQAQGGNNNGGNWGNGGQTGGNQGGVQQGTQTGGATQQTGQTGNQGGGNNGQTVQTGASPSNGQGGGGTWQGNGGQGNNNGGGGGGGANAGGGGSVPWAR